MISWGEGHDGNRAWAGTASAVGKVRVGWGEDPEQLERQVRKMEGSLITVVGVA